MRKCAIAAALGWLSLAVATPPAAAEPRTVTGVSYERPADAAWTEQAIDTGMLYQWDFQNAANGRSGAAILVMTGTIGFRGDMDSALVQLMDSAGLLVGLRPTQSHTGRTTDGYPMVWAMRAGSIGDNPSSEAVVAVVSMQQAAGLASAMMILVNVEDARRDTIDATFDALVGSMRMGGPGRPALPTPQPGTQALDGLYLYTVTSFAPNPMGGTSMRYDWKLRQFDPRGYFADRPALAGETLDSVCVADPGDCGTYRVAGDQVTLSDVRRFGLVESRDYKMAATEKGFSLGGYPYEPAQPVGAATLNGSWRFNHFTGGPGGSITVIRQIDFTADGHYKRTGFAGATVNNPVEGVSTTTSGADPEQSGRYAIDGLTLTLTSEAGTSEKISLVATNPADLGFLFIDGDLYARVEE